MVIKPLRQAFQWAGNSVAVTACFACFELVHRTAVRALGMTFTGHIQVNLGVGVPDFHVSLGAGAKDTTLWVQIFGQKFNGLAHEQGPSWN
jgi:hypothetical protein